MTSSFLRHPPKRGTCPGGRGGSAALGAEGREEVKGDFTGPLQRSPLHSSTAGAAQGPHFLSGLRPPLSAAGSKRADSPGAEQKGWGGPSAVPSPAWDSICCASLGS